MTPLVIYASRENYRRHLAPLADALGLPIHRLQRSIPHGPTLIAGAADLGHVPRASPVALLEHGAGQRYLGLDHRSWAGGKGRDRVSLFLVPRREIAEANLGRYPDAEAVVVGCPALDQHHGMKVHTGRPVVAFTFHPTYQASRQVPELRSALPHYEVQLPEIVGGLRDAGMEVVGHFHPQYRIANLWRRLGVRCEPDWDEVIRTASVLVADNTSASAESAAVGLGVVYLNAPWYRRDVHHGGRFWSWPGLFGTSVDGPEDVVAGVAHGLSWNRDLSTVTARRHVYGAVWGDATARAVEAVRAWVERVG